ncbi:MAG: UbiA family prenyltransferase [Methanocellales archaeon]|nr:UbiA family prenyltransferase [Methanocellales archaeon]
MQEPKVPTSDLLFNYAMYSERTLKNRILAFICEQRQPVVIMGYPIALAGATLALGHLPTILEMVQIFVAVYLIVSSMHVIHDVIDFERDKKKWPMRSLSTGLIGRHELAVYGIFMGAVGTALAYLWFTWQCTLIVILVLILGSIYTKCMRDKIGYLTVIWIPAFLPVGGWAAFSPQTLFTSLPWLLYLFMVMHQVGMIVSAEPRALAPEVKAFLIKPEPRKEAMLYVFSVVLMFIIGVIIYLSATLHWIYLVMLSVLTIFSLVSGMPMLRDPMSVDNVKKAFMAIVNYNIFYWLALAVGSVV